METGRNIRRVAQVRPTLRSNSFLASQEGVERREGNLIPALMAKREGWVVLPLPPPPPVGHIFEGIGHPKVDVEKYEKL